MIDRCQLEWNAKGIWKNKFISSFTLEVKKINSRMTFTKLGLSLTFTTIWANSGDDKLVIFFLLSQKKRFDIPCNGDNLHEMLNLVFWNKYEIFFKMLPADNFTHSAKS